MRTSLLLLFSGTCRLRPVLDTRVWHPGGRRLEALERAFGGSVLSDVLSTTAKPAEPAAAPARGKHGKAAAKPAAAAGAADTRARRSEAAWSSRGACGTMCVLDCRAPTSATWSRVCTQPRVLVGHPARPLLCGRHGERLSVPHAAFPP